MATPWVGTEHDHILRITDSGRDVTAVVCTYTYRSAEREHEGEYRAHAGNPFEPNAGIYPMRMTMTAPATDEPPMRAQTGPARPPSDNVFDGWRVTGHDGGLFATSTWPEYERDRDTCATKAPDPPDRRQFLISSYHPRSEFPTLSPYPGWSAVGG